MSFFRFLFCLIALFLLPMLPAWAQKYRTALGVRLGKSELGITLTQRISEHGTVEVLGTAMGNDLTATALARHHVGFLGRSLNFYGGLGPHLGDNQETGTFYGGTLVAGIEWKVWFFPAVISYDWMPSISVHRPQRFNNATAISLRYVILKEKREGFLRKLFGGGRNKQEKKDK